MNEADLQAALEKLVEAEILYQRGIGEQARYFFKHALIQDTAYQSLLKSTRQQYHQQIAHVLEEQFPDTKTTQPELLAHHYTEANLTEQAMPYWQQAGQQAGQRSANAEAISHLSKALELLQTLPHTLDRVQRELALHLALGAPLMATKGYSAQEVGAVYTRAQQLCRQVGESPELFIALRGLFEFQVVKANYKVAYELGEQCLALARRLQDPALLLEAHFALGLVLHSLGEFSLSLEHAEQGISLYNPMQHATHAILYGQDPGVTCRFLAAWSLVILGYPVEAKQRLGDALALAHQREHPHTLAVTLTVAAMICQYLGESPRTQEYAEESIALCTEQRFSQWLAVGVILRGWAITQQEQCEEGIAQICDGLAAHESTDGGFSQPYYLALLAEGYGRIGWAEKGLVVLDKALTEVQFTKERRYEAELYRLKGELTLQKESKVQSLKSQVADPQSPTPDPQGEAEACFLQAIDIAQKQHAKSWELRAATSLVRLWQQQALQQGAESPEQGVRNTQHATCAKLAEAHKLLSEVYNWFTEGFDTKDLQEAKALLESLGSSV